MIAGGALALAVIGTASWLVHDQQQAEKQRLLDTGRAEADRHFRAALDQQYASVPQLETALNEYLSALELHPAHARARYDLGHVYAQTGKPADALDSFNRALAATAAPLDRSQRTDAEKQLRTLGSVDVSFASANGVKKPPIEARDDGHTGVWPRSATKSGGFLPPFPSGCPQEGPSTVLQSLTGEYPSFVLRLLADPSWGQRTGKAYVNRA